MKGRMVRVVMVMIFFAVFTVMPRKAGAQLYEAERLVLDIEKLLQLKNILTDLYKGYEILSTGYNTIKDISEGNFSLHKAFLDGLLAVSPTVQKYERVVDIVEDQGRIVSEYKAAYNLYRRDAHFSVDEVEYMFKVYDQLVSRSEKNLENLLNVVTAEKLRMSDAERLHAIDGIYDDTHEELFFLRGFNGRAAALGGMRAKGEDDEDAVRRFYGDE